ncbi:VOC family protein [Mycobacterium haemophilum]|uniref:Glyoxalase/bleomycin resistance protein/dioxygenase n=1 Tax=Mycobacterium haemophilum TaxID=29311 RepID=A0A0I9UJX1_9MYCO|nr:VOC family protein [Mycobacterium haemophilum]AKN16519.1 bleomycin resistance protein [Mycobacterium haemophilum DSM 44634]KLO30642.1 glyoxalase/bleomycin resistance protein/dioxygenase [Mycobacterium haemophilum]KLO37686.1 glyoxalase/bleomycin resistance protein/dioxygenase [Mycobacterium haemophilum]KLO43234.1 glyoxalase/bleomycin resistance protein/dioxygenase [Mycobacterium haemophilum]KLO55508.1 glyoxalase/bleomycin resistance protein/dioxygenase [Mycobacterium haemophilum]
MTISFNHTIVASRDKQESAEFLTELFGLPRPTPSGRFMVVALEHGVNLDYADVQEGEEIPRQHYAFLVSDQEFDAIYGKIESRGLPHWADPGAKRPGEINHNDGGRGVYFSDPSGHAMEILTRPYGSGG